ncbi:hypothetical protein AJ80_08649 [Polytolypa hystricis UAMH7299]|uniref:RTA1 domain-containing protein n=1 Tax=Polytolypa hystricis (strain UAMH7299) TaxID=1447883 RepID=A0A2B7X4G3_POLH7|nr:hypothetical protein AJ80_08649 [Polytolypa hystricis UAMH7299]
MAASYATCDSISPSCPVEATTYGYYPNLAGNIIFVVVFGVAALFQLGFGIFFKTWTFMIALAMASLLEMAGYVGRIIMNSNPWHDGAFKLQIVAIVLGPTLVAAAIYLTLKHLVLFIGEEHSRIRPHLYTWIFISCDVGSLVLQAAGGGVAAAAGRKDPKMLEAGNNIIITGIAFQVFTMSMCGLLGLDFFIRAFRNGAFSTTSATTEKTRSWRAFKWFCAAEGLAYTTVLIRCIYRIPEMAGGWGNKLMQNEKEFLILDATMIAIACISLSVFHPGIWFPPMRTGYQRDISD